MGKAAKNLTEGQKKARRKGKLIVTGWVVGAIVVVIGILVAAGAIGYNGNMNKIKNLEAVGSTVETPVYDAENNSYTITIPGDREFKVLQLTDIHIGGGFLSVSKDGWAIEAVATLVERVKPDLVIVTGDIAYPVPFQAGTFNNKREAQMFGELMDKLDVYWALTFGNHDTESYSYFDRDDIAKMYFENSLACGGKWDKLLFSPGPEGIYGSCNYTINVKNDNGYVQSFFIMDSNAYMGDDPFGIMWNYDRIHDDQVAWYESEVGRIKALNGGNVVKSMIFFHIPLTQYRDAWEEFRANGYKNTADVTYYYGFAGEGGDRVCCSEEVSPLFDAVLRLGSTKGIFCGHDHLNNWSVEYKGVRLTYGMSVDYLAYFGIYKKYEQRGGTVITVQPDGSFAVKAEPLADGVYRGSEYYPQ